MRLRQATDTCKVHSIPNEASSSVRAGLTTPVPEAAAIAFTSLYLRSWTHQLATSHWQFNRLASQQR